MSMGLNTFPLAVAGVGRVFFLFLEGWIEGEMDDRGEIH